MSRFGPSDKGPSPKKASPVSPKKKAFVSTIKRMESFGPIDSAPPLPPVVHAHYTHAERRPALEHHTFVECRPAPELLTLSHSHLLQKQSVRWLNLSLGLWSLAVLDVPRPDARQSVAQFLEVVSWRAHGKVTAEEFSILYSE
jgi:hypothetical protein